jgi:hypothetical protein
MPTDVTQSKAVKAYYFGHSLLAGSGASPNYHIPYNIGLLAGAKGYPYEAHGQLGWGTPLTAHWEWDSSELAQGPQGFTTENHAPFYPGRNGKAELARGGYNWVVFTDVNGNARGGRQGPVVEALVGFVELARKQQPNAQAILYSCWNELPVADQVDKVAVKAWRDATLSELKWWEGVADKANAELGSSAPLLLVPVSAVIAELALDAANGLIQGESGPLPVSALFVDAVHGTPLTYYAAANALYTAMYREPPTAASEAAVKGSVGGVAVDYALPSLRAAQYIQQRAASIVREYARSRVPG